ncbi:MAG TPA: phospholipase D-like domain-containing protein, partial [candidate division Zixibacteria bacterium]|nr:phospholipase D-like domain-containing protein [candidate division Zixibacteria bacterium]
MSENLICIGSGKALAYIRGDLRRATKSLFLVGPWIDDYVAEQLVLVAPKKLDARVLIRPEKQVQSDVWNRILTALYIFADHWDNFEVRVLERLHAKCLCIDSHVVYVGSANWYRYSLEESMEVVLRGNVDGIYGIDKELEGLWEKGEILKISGTSSIMKTTPATGITKEVLDPIALRTLKQNPKAFVLGKKK